MPTKRTYVQSGPPLKRAKTLTQEVAKLKKQVSQNKHEVKYFDSTLFLPNGADRSIFFQDTFPLIQDFIGRKAYIHKIEYSFEYVNFLDRVLLYRMRKGNAVAKASPTQYPINVDPELHTMLRFHTSQEDTTKVFLRGLIDFKGSPRLLEFDDSNGTSEGTVITVGDIRVASTYSDTPTGSSPQMSYRVWYHDG